MGNVEKGQSTTTKRELTFQEILNTIGDILSPLACSENVEYGEEEDDSHEDTGHGKLSDNDEPGWVMGTMSKTVQHHIKSIRGKKMRLYALT